MRQFQCNARCWMVLNSHVWAKHSLPLTWSDSSQFARIGRTSSLASGYHLRTDRRKIERAPSMYGMEFSQEQPPAKQH
eukprot:6049240-Amphidinium_carterae.1